MNDQLTDLEAKRDQLVSEIQLIDTQLSSMDRRDGEGNRMSAHDYHAWRRSAIAAKTHIMQDLRTVKASITEIKREDGDSRLERIEKKIDEIIALLLEEDD